jgi:chromosome segregation ATPase
VESNARNEALGSVSERLKASETRVGELKASIDSLTTELELERAKRIAVERSVGATDAARVDAEAARDAAFSTARAAETALAAKARAAEIRARSAEDDQLRAEEDAAAARAELEDARRELAEALSSRRKAKEEKDEEDSSRSETLDERLALSEARFEEERFALASEIRLLTRKLDAARLELAETRDAAARAEASFLERDKERLAETAETAQSIEKEKEARNVAEARLRDAETALAELRAEKARAEKKQEAAEANAKAAKAEAERVANETEAEDDAAAVELVGTEDEPLGSGLDVSSLTASLATLRLERDAFLEKLNAKIRSSNETQDTLLRELDARDGEIESLDARLAAALEDRKGLDEKLDAALAMARAERVRNERLVEMLEEQAVWGEGDLDAEDSRESEKNADGSKTTVEEVATKTKSQKKKKDAEREILAGGAGGIASAPSTPARENIAPSRPISVAESPAAKLAAEILAGSELGRAYHPLLASIEARLLHLRNEKLPDITASMAS